MNSYRTQGVVAALALFVYVEAFSQVSSSFDTTTYKQFLTSHQNLTTEQLQLLYPAGTFSAETYTACSSAKYFDSINIHYSFTAEEQSLLNKNGFVVTERLKRNSFGNAFLEIYNDDLPGIGFNRRHSPCVTHVVRWNTHANRVKYLKRKTGHAPFSTPSSVAVDCVKIFIIAFDEADGKRC